VSVMSYLYDFIVHSSLFFIFFFFQAEDGIRDRTVTGVQTCALPIYDRVCFLVPNAIVQLHPHGNVGPGLSAINGVLRAKDAALRSEERRVGKECRSRWSTYQ